MVRSRDLLLPTFFGWVLAFTLPSLFVLWKNPEFLRAQGLTVWEGLLLFLTIALLVPGAVAGSVFLVGCRLGIRWFSKLVLLLAFLSFQMPLLERIPILLWLPGALLASALLVSGLEQSPTVRVWFVRTVAAFWLLGSGAFWLTGSVAGALVATEPVGIPVHQLDLSDPVPSVVMLIFDELPVTALMTADGTIEPEVFPAFAKLSRVSDWYRVTRSLSTETIRSVPQMVTGRREPRRLEESLLTLFRGSHQIFVDDDVIALQPPDRRFRFERLRSAVGDFGYVYLHTLFPRAWRGALPALDDGWRGMGQGEARFSRALESLGRIRAGAKPQFYFGHFLLPHGPYRYREEGRIATPTAGTFGGVELLEDPAFRNFYLQLIATDALLGEVMKRLEKEGLWENCLLIVASDHGILFEEGRPRSSEGDHQYETLYVPFFVKGPGQTQGRTFDTPITLVDLVPIALSVLDLESPWAVDGEAFTVQGGGPELNATALPELIRRAGQKYQRFDIERGSSVYVARSFGDLWGESVPEIDSTDQNLTFLHLTAPLFQAVDLDGAELPLTVELKLKGRFQAGTVVAVALNGRLAATSEPLQGLPGHGQERSLILPVPHAVLKEGKNRLEVYSVSRSDTDTLVWSRILPAQEQLVRFEVDGGLRLRRSASTYSVEVDPMEDFSYRILALADGRERLVVSTEPELWDEVLVVPSEGGDAVLIGQGPRTSFSLVLPPGSDLGDYVILVRKGSQVRAAQLSGSSDDWHR